MTKASGVMALSSNRKTTCIDWFIVFFPFAPKQRVFFSRLFAGDQLGWHFQVFDFAGLGVDSSEVVSVVMQKPMPVPDHDVGVVCIGMPFATFHVGVFLAPPFARFFISFE